MEPQAQTDTPRYSIIIPLPVDGEVLNQHIDNLSATLDEYVAGAYEIVSVDRTHPEQIAEELDQINGEVIILIDGDLSHPPELLREMIQAFETGADLILGGHYAENASEEEPVLTCFGLRLASAHRVKESPEGLRVTLDILGPEALRKMSGNSAKPEAGNIVSYLRSLINN